MIRNLNQLTFRDFGTVLSERAHTGKPVEKAAGVRMELSSENSELFRARSLVRISADTGNAVLSVSTDGKAFFHFYLDKSVELREGIYYSLSPFVDVAAARVLAAGEPEHLGSRSPDCLRIVRRCNVESIYTFFYHEKEQGFLFSGEAHPMVELTYVDQGSMHSVADGRDLLLKQGDIVLYGPNQWHMQYSDIGVAPRYVTITFDVGGTDLTPLVNRVFTAPQNVVSLLQQMLREQEKMDPWSNDVILSQLNLLLLHLIREAENPSGRKLQTSNSVHSENEIIRQAQQYVSAHIREKLSVPMVARQVDVSPSYLTALFHKNLQISPGEYIRRIKLQESKQKIRENHLNFTEIAAELQYSTVHHFSRQFKDKFGITPTEYAKSVR